ncbi:MAG: hypothetical protein ACK56I_12685, partial [bacterium]
IELAQAFGVAPLMDASQAEHDAGKAVEPVGCAGKECLHAVEIPIRQALHRSHQAKHQPARHVIEAIPGHRDRALTRLQRRVHVTGFQVSVGEHDEAQQLASWVGIFPAEFDQPLGMFDRPRCIAALPVVEADHRARLEGQVVVVGKAVGQFGGPLASPDAFVELRDVGADLAQPGERIGQRAPVAALLGQRCIHEGRYAEGLRQLDDAEAWYQSMDNPMNAEHVRMIKGRFYLH